MREMFNRYKKNILYQMNNNEEKMTVNDVLMRNNLNNARIAGVFFFLLNVYYLIRDLINNFYEKHDVWENFFAILLLILSSLYITIISSLKHKKYDNNLNRFSILGYDLCLIVSTFILNYTLNNRAVLWGASSDFIGITLSTIYVVFFIITPLTKTLDSIILMSAMFLGAIILAFVPGKEVFNIFTHFSFRLVILIAYFHFKKQLRQAAEQSLSVKILNSKLIETSYTDYLTKALNRNALDTYLELLKYSSNNTIGVIMFDIDSFKKYNDTYSHLKGDEALIKICDVIVKQLQDNDPYLFRYGGEEFIIIVSNVNEDELIEIANNYRLAVWNANIIRDDNTTYPRITISIGCSIIDLNKEKTLEKYNSEVDLQLYLCKSNGKNCVAMNNKIYK